jgi:hypothetical protein
MTDPPHLRETGNDSGMEYDHQATTGIPGWTKVVGIIVAVVALLVIVMLLVGTGSGHRPPGGSSDQSPGGTVSSSDRSPGGTFSAKQQAAFARCMREQGIDFRSRVGANGQVEMSPGPASTLTGPRSGRPKPCAGPSSLQAVDSRPGPPMTAAASSEPSTRTIGIADL